jgi:hypothetical protein
MEFPPQGVRVQLFERSMHGVPEMKFDASYWRRDFIDITKLILLRASLVGGQLAMRKTALSRNS